MTLNRELSLRGGEEDFDIESGTFIGSGIIGDRSSEAHLLKSSSTGLTISQSTNPS